MPSMIHSMGSGTRQTRTGTIWSAFISSFNYAIHKKVVIGCMKYDKYDGLRSKFWPL